MDDHLRVEGREELYAVGDMSVVENPRTGDALVEVLGLRLSG